MLPKRFLTIKDVMRVLSISRRTVYHWIKKDILRPSRVGSVYRFHPDDIESLVKKGRTELVERKIRILSIDDDILVRESLRILFARTGFEASVVSSGKEALSVIGKEPFDLIITDVRMPEMNGIETLKAIRELRLQSGLSQLPEIIISAYEDENAMEESKRMGVRKFIQKPFEWKNFITDIRTVVAQQRVTASQN